MSYCIKLSFQGLDTCALCQIFVVVKFNYSVTDLFFVTDIYLTNPHAGLVGGRSNKLD